MEGENEWGKWRFQDEERKTGIIGKTEWEQDFD